MRIAAWLLAAAELARAQTGTTVSGTVLDSVTHRGLADALVSTDGVRGLTGLDGGFTLKDVAPGRATLHVVLKGYRPVEVAVKAEPAADTRVDAEMHPLGRIWGRVIDHETGRPLRRTVLIEGVKPLEYGGVSFANDGKGEGKEGFEVQGLEAGDYIVTVAPGDSAAVVYDAVAKPAPMTAYPAERYPATIHVADGEQRFVEIPVRRVDAFSVGGEIEFPAGIEEATLILGYRGGDAPFSRNLGRKRAAPFRIDGLAPGRYRVFSEINDGPGRFYGGVSIIVTDHNLEGLRIVMLPSVDVTGQVRMATGEGPLPVMNGILLLLLSTERGRSAPIELKIEADGKFHNQQVPPGDYWVEMLEHPKGYPLLKLLLGEVDTEFRPVALNGSANLALVLTSRPGALAGTVRNGEKLPVKGAIVSLSPEFGDTELMRGTTTGDTGEFVFRDLSPGRYRIVGGPSVEVKSGETSNVDIE